MLRQTLCETSTVQKDVIRLEFQSRRMFTLSVSPPEEDKRATTEGQKETGLKRSNLTQVYWIHASRHPTKRERSWRLTARPHISDGGEEREAVEPGRPALAIDFWGRIYERCSQRVIWRRKYGAIFGCSSARMWMKDFDLVNISLKTVSVM